MKLKTDKKYILYYNKPLDVYNYELKEVINQYPPLLDERTPILYSNDLELVKLTIAKLNTASLTPHL